jgi:hypothetical protein
MYGSIALSALATRGGAHSPVLYCLHWLHLEPTHQYYTVCTGYTWRPLTSTILSALATLGAHSPVLYCLHWLHLAPTHRVDTRREDLYSVQCMSVQCMSV